MIAENNKNETRNNYNNLAKYMVHEMQVITS